TQLVEAIGRESDRKRYFELNRAFHDEIHRAAGRPRLAEFIDCCRNNIGGYVAMLKTDEHAAYALQVQAEHDAILDALRARMPSQAARAMTIHMRNGSRQISAAVARHLSLTDRSTA